MCIFFNLKKEQGSAAYEMMRGNMLDNNATLLFPYQYSTVSSNVVTVTAQAATIGNQLNSYTFELDTSYKFTSPIKQTKTVSGQGIINTNFTLGSQDTLAYYIRVKLSDTIYKFWDVHSFTYIKNSSSGWAQVDYPQYNKSTASQIYMNDGERNYDFSSKSSNTYYFYSVGKNRSNFNNNTSARVFRKNNGENMAIVNGQVKNGWGVVAIDPSTETPYMPSSKYQYISQKDLLGNNIKSQYPDNASDDFKYTVIPVDKDGNEASVAILQNLSTDTFDLKTIDPNQYPFLKVKAQFKDDTLRTPENLKYWIINYKGVPEGTVLNNINKAWLPKDTVSEGDSIRFTFPFKNISVFDFDSVLVHVTLTDFMNNQTVLFHEKVAPIKAGDTLFYSRTIGTKNLLKKNTITVSYNDNYDQPEQYLNNNLYNASFYVKRDLENPLLDVTFDGIRIFDGDLVSASPKIVITATDENKNTFIADTSQMDIRLRYPDGHEEKAAFSSPFVKFIPAEAKQLKATVEFNPEKLADGEYILIAQANDAAGNKAGSQPYMIKFKVNNKPSITRFYPYPNPFTTKTSFVFTVTGEQIPQDIRIQIMTISGIVVKEIFKDELGPIHIGTNTSEYAWEGTDQFGDKLANGVYLYKVTARLNGKDMDLVTDDNEAFFKKGIGKIVIMR
ncbi:MAG: hypothetical protein HYZ42_18190 [Bacteroidetes bacterium]|nr:hypothetical protein [Bacteroidota bacterium]